jgi:hypothetical protein
MGIRWSGGEALIMKSALTVRDGTTSAVSVGALRRWSIALVAVWLTYSMVGFAGPSAADGHLSEDTLAVDEVDSSRNVELIANIPRNGGDAGAFHSDIAFWGDLAIQGSYGGLNIYDISKPQKPAFLTEFICPGGQGDPSVSPDGTLVFLSVDSSRSDDGCSSSPQTATNPASWEGIRIIDISDLGDIQQVATVETKCGSHTHTLVPGDEDTLYLYISSYGPNAAFPDCQPPHDKISIVEVPLDDPASAFVVNEAVLFPDGGAAGTAGCHDITVFPEQDLAGGACMGEGVLLDISDPVNPYVITSITDANFAFWHSATFTNDASAVIFTDELGGGGGATCIESLYPERGANAYFDIIGEGDDREFVFRSYFKIPRLQGNDENCVAHNASLIPTQNGRTYIVQSWYQGGVSIVDYTDPDNPTEVGYFERGKASEFFLGGSWSAYWYNGYVYSSDILKGLDVLRITGLEGVPSANSVKQDHFNAQTQYSLGPGR